MLVLQKARVIPRNRRGVVNVEKTPSVREIEKILGFNKVQPILLTPSDAADTQEKEQELKDWYEYELRKFFEESH